MYGSNNMKKSVVFNNQFTPKFGGQFELENGGQFAPELVVNLHWKVVVNLTGFSNKETNKTFVFLTNNFDLTALQIALLYKQRWQIELFFKWIKQHLKVKTFWGTSENAVRIQINIAIITFCLVSILAKDLKINRTNYEILQILSVSLLDKTAVNELLIKSDYNDVNELDSNQLNFSLF